MWECYMLSGFYMTEGARNAVWDTAIEVLRYGKEWTFVKTPEVEGRVETEGKTAVLGDLFGYVCTAEIDTEHGSGTLTFLVRGPRSEDGHWFVYQPFGHSTLN